MMSDGSGAHVGPAETGGVSIEALSCGIDGLRVTLDAPARRLDPSARRRVDEWWERETARNPRLFDGPVLSCVEIDAPGGLVRCRRASYRDLACQPTVESGVMQLSVTGVTTVRGPDGREHVVLGRRGAQTRVYAGMWELAPSGGVDHPVRAASDEAESLGGRDLWRQLMVEFEEELGLEDLPGPIAPVDPMCLCIDRVARSVDVVFLVRVPGRSPDALARGDAGWEYGQVRCVPIDGLREFDLRHGAEIIGPTRALMRWMGWV